jgi:hypothetical protein
MLYIITTFLKCQVIYFCVCNCSIKIDIQSLLGSSLDEDGNKKNEVSEAGERSGCMISIFIE